MAKRGGQKSKARKTEASEYRHIQAESPLRPDVGTQAQFRKKKPPAKYRYDSSLSPALDWDGQNPAREQGAARIAQLQAEIAALRGLNPPSPLASQAKDPVSPSFSLPGGQTSPLPRSFFSPLPRAGEGRERGLNRSTFRHPPPAPSQPREGGK